jgi:LPXTG-motif cell wall-anchored protein
VVLNGTTPESPGDDDNGGLPVTGTPVAIIAGVGLLLAASGFVLYRMARRRRLTEV